MLFQVSLIDPVLSFPQGFWQLLVLVVGLLCFVLLTAYARRIGRQAAMHELRKWLRLPAAVLGFFDAPTVEMALVSLLDKMIEIVNAAGGAAFVVSGGAAAGRVRLEALVIHGTFRSASDRELEQVLTNLQAIRRLLEYPQENTAVVYLEKDDLSGELMRCCPDLGRGTLLAICIRLHLSGTRSHSTAMLLFDLGAQKPDPELEGSLEDALAIFPGMMEKITLRFSHAAELEWELKNSRLKDRILQQMLSGYQHDLSHALSSLEQGILAIRKVVEDDPGSQGEASNVNFNHLLAALQLTTQVAAGGTMMVEIAEGDTALADMRSWDPEDLYLEAIQPLMALRKTARTDLAVHVEIEPDLPNIRVDQAAFFRVVSNVLHNAFKFTREGGVNLLVHQSGRRVCFTVSDTGIGIPEGDLEHLGEIQYRAANAVEIPGTGLGIWTVKQLVESMEGKVEIRSRIGIGTTVQLSFPAAVHREPSLEQPSASRGSTLRVSGNSANNQE